MKIALENTRNLLHEHSDRASLLLGDCLDQMHTLADNSVDGIVTDPPYALTGASGSGGFMGSKWDSELPTVEMWKEALRVAKPGAHLLAFGGTRTYHRLACAIEDAGWEIRDCIMWVYGCLSDDTEIATPEGWKRRGEIKVGDMVIAFDRAYGKTLSQPVQRVFDYDYDDEAYNIISPLTDQLVSKNHRILSEVNGALDFVYADSLNENDTLRVPVYCGDSRLSDIGVFIGHHEMTTASVSLTHYKGRMWCVSVPAGAIVARRNGKMFATGNSGFPKSMDVSKAIDRSRNENHDRALEFTRWLRSTGITAEQIDEATKSKMSRRLLALDAAASIATEEKFEQLRPLLPEVPEFIERLVAERTGVEWSDYAKRHVVGTRNNGSREGANTNFLQSQGDTYDQTVPYSPEAAAWNGWGTTLKPACEPIVVARKPLEGTVAANVLKYGTGAINIDACRVPTFSDGPGSTPKSSVCGRRNSMAGSMDRVEYDNTKGRFPANLIHDGSPEVLACFPESKGQCGAVKGNEPSELTRGIYGKFSGDRTPCAPRGDSGSAARFFNSFRDGEASADRRYTAEGSTNFAMKPGMRRPAEDTPARFFYCAKAARSERGSFNDHCTVKPLSLMRWLITLVTPPGGTVLDPFMGSGTTGVAARQLDRPFIGIEREPHYYEIAQRRVLGEVPQVDSPEKKPVPKQDSPDTSQMCDGYPTDPKPIQGELF